LAGEQPARRTLGPAAMIWFVATIAAVRPETPSARTLVLTVPGWPGHEAGQHVDVRLTAPDGYSAVRSYSIASAPDGDRVEITVDTVADGEVSTYLTGLAAVGYPLEIRGPIGGWFVWRPNQWEPVQLIAGGSGIVPLMAMIRVWAASGSQAPLRLLYSVRGPDSIFYRDELERLRDTTAVSVTYVFTRDAPPGWERPPGRLDAAFLRHRTWPARRRPTLYVCGPTSFVEAVADFATGAGHDPARVRTERFGPSSESD